MNRFEIKLDERTVYQLEETRKVLGYPTVEMYLEEILKEKAQKEINDKASDFFD